MYCLQRTKRNCYAQNDHVAPSRHLSGSPERRRWDCRCFSWFKSIFQNTNRYTLVNLDSSDQSNRLADHIPSSYLNDPLQSDAECMVCHRKGWWCLSALGVPGFMMEDQKKM
ncbi:hypothetical protein B0T21DRAFT_173357 [Apiosordaria backusii]|uniref:Uncharacterized protein n=1 Tax=Apiosordaria backusii TaxID=314023 RepID=A0AA40EDL9_9PEZI|nr:hypothetical protein B0T21DRAFT_173357 [Apiosordaria backusii]